MNLRGGVDECFTVRNGVADAFVLSPAHPSVCSSRGGLGLGCFGLSAPGFLLAAVAHRTVVLIYCWDFY
ncbi:hypothetical protein AGR4C_pa50036 [Agrobacterium tumefaciens str. Kerr 14]|uniref:Uncharacterized protein n=1 Tax=Agrobacterium tumefaciens str. Kerr 14 TaxID=1183424 RepID=A0A1S7SAS8_AGRTU|nr:hypothetical protein AGR4C_pa50036 [Agrobacterium tumefaciens str. Kerr 14]